VLPVASNESISHCVSIYAVPPADHCKGIAISSLGMHLQHEFFCEDRAPLLAPKMTPSFSDHISHVVFVSSEKQVIRTNARRVVTSVKHMRLGWNLAVMQNPRKPVREFPTPLVTCAPDMPVAVAPATSSPKPTLFSPLDLGPKTSFYRCAKIGAHRRFSFGARPPTVDAVRGPLISGLYRA